jgi:hypothetical protein
VAGKRFEEEVMAECLEYEERTFDKGILESEILVIPYPLAL